MILYFNELINNLHPRRHFTVSINNTLNLSSNKMSLYSRNKIQKHYIHKRPMSHNAHLRKQFKSLNKYDNIKTLIQRIKKKLYENLWVLHLNKLESHSPKDALCQVWLKMVLEKKIFKFRQCIFAICVIISPWKRAGPFI